MSPIPRTVRIRLDIVSITIWSEKISSYGHPNPGDNSFWNCQTISDIPFVAVPGLCYSSTAKGSATAAESTTKMVRVLDTKTHFPRNIVRVQVGVRYVPTSPQIQGKAEMSLGVNILTTQINAYGGCLTTLLVWIT